jgi:hypothetical protein
MLRPAGCPAFFLVVFAILHFRLLRGVLAPASNAVSTRAARPIESRFRLIENRERPRTRRKRFLWTLQNGFIRLVAGKTDGNHAKFSAVWGSPSAEMGFA